MSLFSYQRFERLKGSILMFKKSIFLLLFFILIFSIFVSLGFCDSICYPVSFSSTYTPCGNVVTNVESSLNTNNFIYICDGGNFLTFAPGTAKQIQVTSGNIIDIFLIRGTPLESYYGGYFYYSTDFGRTWDQSYKILSSGNLDTQMLSDFELSLRGIPYISVNFFVPEFLSDSSVISDSILFINFDGDGFISSYIVDNGNDTYRYCSTMEIVGDTTIFVSTMDIKDNSIWLNVSYDLGITWNQLRHFTASDFASLINNNINCVNGLDIGKVIYMPTINKLVFITDVYADIYVNFNGKDSLLKGSSILAYYTSNDFGETWSDPNWVIPNIISNGFGGLLAKYAWKSWQAVLTSDEKIILVSEQYVPKMNWGAVFGSIYNGKYWVSNQIMTPKAPDTFYGIWAKWGVQKIDAIVDDSGNAYAVWLEITDTTIDKNNNVYQNIRLVGAKYDGFNWRTARVLDTTRFSSFFDFGISTHLDTKGNIPILMKDDNGRLIKTLVNGNFNAGKYFVAWNKTDNENNKVAAGIYFYKMIINNRTITKKMVVIN